VEGVEERFVHLQGWFASCEDHHLPSLVGYIVEVESFGYDFVGGHLCIFGEIRVAPRAAEVASAETDEDRRDAGVGSFALQGIEYFVNAIH
jgi:hypothetical protein